MHVIFILKRTAVMGVLTLRIFVCGQLLLLLSVLNNISDAQKPWRGTTIEPPLNATGNHTENNASNSSSISAYNHSTATTNLTTTQVTPIVSTNITMGPTQNNLTVTGSSEQPNTTENTQTTHLATTSTINISSTAVTATDNRTDSSTENATSSTTITAITSTTVTQTSINAFTESLGLNHSEKSMTVLFSVLLGVIVLVVLGHFAYKFGRSKERSVQYTHRRLQNEDAGEQFGVPDDTLVISGGLYDGPQIYNPTMTEQNEDEVQTERYGFASRSTQFRLEFLREDQDRALDHETSTFHTFHAQDQEP